MTAEAVASRHDGALGAAALVAAAAGGLGGSWLLLPTAAALVTAWIAWRDARSFIIPNEAAAALAALGIAARLAEGGGATDALGALAVDVALTGGLLWAVREAYFRARGRDGLGLGDVKLAAAAGCLAGAAGFAVALFAASLAGLVVAALRRAGREDRLPFGALLAPAVWVVWAAAGFAAPGLLG
ncbi:prepilin peptidase [Methylopila sp. 73B]|uniref:prepilin peptidase n=1 Tax=Methylopila sp. 73B TaxID=1120792 RepID=UPI00036FC589|nr:prepilin peptidase [Methylopila sp. 73B]